MADSKAIILNRMLADIDSNYDKSQGSFFYDVLSATAIEFEKKYKENENEIRKKHVDTAIGKELEELVKEYANMERKHSTQSSNVVIITGSNGYQITEGEMVASDGLNFIFTESTTIADGTAVVAVKCEKYGSIGNVPVGAIKYFPKTLLGLKIVNNTLAFTNGYNEETNEELRTRYYTKVKTPVTSSNKNAYKNWALSINGVGSAKVKSLWDGPGTVKVIIINSNKMAADSTLVQSVKNLIDPGNGDGEGESNIGPVCTVISAVELSINITVTLTIDTDTTSTESAKLGIESGFTDYLADIAFSQDYVSYAKIGSIILGTIGIKDYSNLKVNGGTSNITVGDEQVAVLGGVTLG